MVTRTILTRYKFTYRKQFASGNMVAEFALNESRLSKEFGMNQDPHASVFLMFPLPFF
jgi:hypothetical protein